jgi:hypothetical protein
LLSLWINFHWYLPDFHLVQGDRGDTRLVVFTLEHWYRALQGLEPFFRLQMFYPDPNALAYADGLFLFGLPYAAFRMFGLDFLSSYQLVQMLLTIVGFLGWMRLLRHVLRLSVTWSVVGGILLTSLNALQLQADIGKLSAVNLFPILFLWLWGYLGATERGQWRPLLGLAGFAAGLGLLFFTSYYPAWLLVLTLVVLATLALVAAIVVKGAGKALGEVWAALRKQRRAVALAVGAFLFSLIPFIATYAPLVVAGSSRGFDLVLEFSPTPLDIVNVSANNVMWGGLLQTLGFDFGNREVQMGSPPLVLLVAGITTLVLVRRLSGTGWRGLSTKERMLLLLAGTATALVLFSLRFGNLSLWYFSYRILPGASALRAVGRVLIMVDLILIVLALWGLDELWRAVRKPGARAPRIMLAGIGIALIAEQVNWTPFTLDKTEQLSRLERYAAPEQDCEAFYVTNASADGAPFGYHQLDAMMIGMKLGMPTVNGYSGFEPHEAFTLIPRGPEYKYRTLDWLRGRGVDSGICELDLIDGTFRQVEVETEFAQAQQVFRRELLQDFTALFEAANAFLNDARPLADLYPQYLEENGYLDPSFGYQTGVRYRWLDERYWIGERACGNKRCLGIAVVGVFSDLRPILEQYAPLARDVYFPSPEPLITNAMPEEASRGELLLIFSAPQPGE